VTSTTRKRIGVAIVLSIVSVMAMAVLVRSLIDRSDIEQLIVSRLERHLGREVNVASMAVTLLPRPGLARVMFRSRRSVPRRKPHS
jgi:hypothetical protein